MSKVRNSVLEYAFSDVNLGIAKSAAAILINTWLGPGSDVNFTTSQVPWQWEQPRLSCLSLIEICLIDCNLDGSAYLSGPSATRLPQ